MKKTLAILLVLVLVFASVATVFAAEGEIDYSQWNSNSAYPSDVVNTKLFTPVKFLVDKGVVEGYDDGLYHPDWSVTRAEYIKMLLIATNNDNALSQYQNKSGFSDTQGHWADKQGYIGAGVAAGLINGYPDGTFKPDDKVSYAEMGAMFLRTKGIKDAQLQSYGSNFNQRVQKYLDMYNMDSTMTNVYSFADDATRGNVAHFLYKNLPKPAAPVTTGGGVTP